MAVPKTRARLVDILAAPNAWPIRMVEAMPKPKTKDDQQEHDQIGVEGGRQRFFAKEAADPDGVDRAVQRLEDRGDERRQREQRATSCRSALRSGRRACAGPRLPFHLPLWQA